MLTNLLKQLEADLGPIDTNELNTDQRLTLLHFALKLIDTLEYSSPRYHNTKQEIIAIAIKSITGTGLGIGHTAKSWLMCQGEVRMSALGLATNLFQKALGRAIGRNTPGVSVVGQDIVYDQSLSLRIEYIYQQVKRDPHFQICLKTTDTPASMRYNGEVSNVVAITDHKTKGKSDGRQRKKKRAPVWSRHGR